MRMPQADIDALATRLSEAGIPIHQDQAVLRVTDPSGNAVKFVAG